MDKAKLTRKLPPNVLLREAFELAVLSAMLFFSGGIPAAESAPKGQPSWGAENFRPTPETPFGWRGDGNGRFPAAEPPLKWGRESKAVKELCAQAHKPKDGETGKPASDGIIREWLVLGPAPVPEGKNLKDDFSPDEGKYEPAEGAKAGEIAWKAVTCETACLNFWPLFGKAGEIPKGKAAYACTWLYSASGKPVFMDFVASADTRVWLNGNAAGAFGALGSRVKLVLAQGWNRLLLRVAPLPDTGWSKGAIEWYVTTGFFGVDPAEYESQNILWSTVLPDNGPGAGSPIIVGGKIFVPCELCDLVCVQKTDGKVLWAASNTLADAATDEERKAHADVFAEIAPLQAEVKTLLAEYCANPQPPSQKHKGTGEAERKINTLMKKVDADKYSAQSGSEAGESAPTPVSDGECVYATFGSGVAACYSLDGTRKWATSVAARNSEHGCCSSPCLVDGKVVIQSPLNFSAIALDCKTGAVIWKKEPFKNGLLNMMATPVKVPLGGENQLILTFGTLMRAKDGEILAQALRPIWPNVSDMPSPVFEGQTICSEGWHTENGKIYNGCAFQTLPGTAAGLAKAPESKICVYDTHKFPTWFSYNQCGSPLLYQGLAYLVNTDGVLTVIDAQKAEVVYQQQLDVTPFTVHGGAIRGGCASSPTLAGKYIFIWDNQGSAVIVEPGRTFKQAGRNRIEQLYYAWGQPTRNEAVNSCPVFEGKRIFCRGEVKLYCLGDK